MAGAGTAKLNEQIAERNERSRTEEEQGSQSDFWNENSYALNPDDPNYVAGSAARQQQYGAQAAQQMWDVGQRAIGQAEQYGQALYQQGQQAQGGLVQMGTSAQQQLGLGAHQAQAGLTAAGAQGASDIRSATGAGGSAIYQAGQLGAQQLGGLSAAAQAQQAAAAGRQYSPLDFAAANQSLGGVTGLQGQLAGLEATQGPSAAQAQLQSGLNQAQQSALAMAKSGRGWGGSASALNQAAAQNAQASQQAANQSAMLRAQEDAAWRQRQAANLGAAGQIGLGVAGQQAGQTQFGGDLALRQQALSDQTALGYGGQALQATGMGADQRLQGATAAGQLGLQGAGMAADTNLRGLEQGYGMGLQGLQSSYDLGLRGLEQGYGMGLQGTQSAGEMGLAGQQLGGLLAGQAGQMGIGGEQAANQLYLTEANQYRGQVQDWLTQYGIDKGVAVQNAQMQNQMIGAGASAAASMLPLLLAASDRDAKTGIEPAGEIRMSAARNQVTPGLGPGRSPAPLGSGGSDYDKAMGSAARASRQFGSEQEGANMLEMPLNRQKFMDMAQGGLQQGLQRAGGMLQSGGGNPYMYNPYAQKYLASDRDAKFRIAQLEDQVSNMGGDPGESRDLMPLVYDPRDKIYRPYEPAADRTGGFVRNTADSPWAVADPRIDRAALDEAHRRESGREPGPARVASREREGAPLPPPPGVRDVGREDFFPGNYRVLGGAADTYNPYGGVDIDALDDAYRRESGLEPIAMGPRASDRNSKTKIAQLENQIEMMGGNPAAAPWAPVQSSVDVGALDDAYRSEAGLEPVMPRDALRATADAPAYTFEYKEPERFGYGRQVSQMAQDWERNPHTKQIVTEAPDGTKLVDTSKLAMITSAAVSQQQAQIDELARRVGTSRKEIDGPATEYNPYNYDRDALDDAYRRASFAPQSGYPGLF